MLRNVGLRKSVEQPVLDLNFAASQIGSNGAPDSRIDFSRGSNAWFVDSDGLVKKSPHNLVNYSENLSGSGWSTTNAVVATDSISAPDGTLTADKITDDTTSGLHGASYYTGSILTQSVTYYASAYLKKGTGRYVQFYCYHGSGDTHFINVDLEDGSIDRNDAYNDDASVVDVGDGWYRFTLAIRNTSDTNTSIVFYIANDSNYTVSYTGSSGSPLNIYVWGVQLAQHTTLPVDNPYIKTEGSAVYAARLDHDPTWFMSAAQEQNLLEYSEMLDDSGWTKTRASVTANATTAPDGTTTAEKLYLDSTNSTSHFAIQNTEILPGVKHTFSVYLKADDLTHAHVSLINNTSPFEAIRIGIDLSDGSTGSLVVGNGATDGSFSVTDAGNGWYRVAVSGIIGSSATAWGVVYLAESTSTFVVATGDGSSGLFVWGAQLEVGSTASTYHRTEGAPYYGPGATPKGLLIEEARTNLITDSEDFSAASWSPFPSANLQVNTNQVLAPDGTTTADELEVTGTPSAGVYKINDALNLTSGQTYIGSVFGKKSEQRYLVLAWEGAALSGQVKGGVDLETGNIVTGSDASTAVEDYGNGWYRVSVAATPTSSGSAACSICINDADDITISHTPTAGDSIYLWGAQIEAGSFPTSYIQTTGSTATRNADVATMGPTTGGTELVTNGTFDTDTTGWTSSHATLSVSSNKLRIEADNATGGIVAYTASDVPVVSGRRYRLTSDVTITSGNGLQAKVYTSSFAALVGNGSTVSSGTGTSTLDFTATTDSVIVSFARISSFSADDDFLVDNISVRELYPFEQYNPSEGTVLFEANVPHGMSNFSAFFNIADDGSYNNRVSIINNGTDSEAYTQVQSGGATIFNTFGNAVSYTYGTSFRVALAYAAADFASTIDANTVRFSTSGAVPAMDSLKIGLDANNANHGNFHARRVRIFPKRLPNSILQSLTSD